MKKLLVIPALVGVLTLSLPVLASSPTASGTVSNNSGSTQQETVTTAPAASAAADAANATATPAENLTAEEQAATSELAGSIPASTPSAATAVASTLVKAADAAPLTTASITAEAEAILAKYTPAQRAIIEKAAKIRNLSLAEVIANFVKADAELPGSVAFAWDENVCRSAVDGKAGRVNVIIQKPKKAGFTAEALSKAATVSPKAKVLNTFVVSLQGGKQFKTLETGFRCEGITAKDTVANFACYQQNKNGWEEVKILAVGKNSIALQLKGTGPIVLIRK